MRNSHLFRLIATALLFATFVTTAAPLFSSCNGTTPSGSSTPSGTPNPTPCEHEWADADCETPKTCTKCNETDGDPIGHDWEEASYSAPKTCKTCGATEGDALESPIPDDKNLALMIDKLTVAKPGMTEDELRDIVVEFMKLQLTFAYTPNFGTSDSYSYYIKNLLSAYGFEGTKITFEEGKYYGGIPYMGNSAGSLYRWLEYYDPASGVMDWTPLLRTNRPNWKDGSLTYPDVGSDYFGNTCASSCVWAYLRVSNKIKTFWSDTWIPANGFIKVGDYKLSSNDDHGSSTKKICTNNGTQKMYDSYAKMKKADGIVQTGHAAMIIANPVVVYNSNGTINAEESYVLVAEQKASFLTAAPSKGGVDLYSPLNDKGVVYRIMGNYPDTVVNEQIKEMKWSFQFLYDEGYLPFTIPELCGQDPVEEVKFTFSHTKSSITLSELQSKTIYCNYAISDLHITIKDRSGNEIYSAMYCKKATDASALKTVSINDAFTKNELFENNKQISLDLADYANGNYIISLVCRVSTGELLTVYTGKLTQ